MQIVVNDVSRQVKEALTISELLLELELTVRHVAVEVNKELVPREEHVAYRLSENDRLEVVTLVGGG